MKTNKIQPEAFVISAFLFLCGVSLFLTHLQYAEKVTQLPEESLQEEVPAEIESVSTLETKTSQMYVYKILRDETQGEIAYLSERLPNLIRPKNNDEPFNAFSGIFTIFYGVKVPENITVKAGNWVLVRYRLRPYDSESDISFWSKSKSVYDAEIICVVE